MVDSGALDVLTEDECYRLMGEVPIGRIVFIDQTLPAVQPVNFVMERQTVVIRTAPRSRLAIAAAGTVVAFETDELAEIPSRRAWSVVAVGRATEITEPEELDSARRLGLRPWAAGRKDYYLRITIELISGRMLPGRQ